MALAREKLTQDWPAKRFLSAIVNSGVGVGVCVYTDMIRASGNLTREECNHASGTLLRRGFVERCYYLDGPRKKGGYKLTAAGLRAHELDISLKPGPVALRPTGGARAKAWTAMRIRTKFTLDDLEVLCATGDEVALRSNLTKYINALIRSGHVLRFASCRGLYLLKNNSGPEAPVWNAERKVVTDPNTGVVHELA